MLKEFIPNRKILHCGGGGGGGGGSGGADWLRWNQPIKEASPEEIFARKKNEEKELERKNLENKRVEVIKKLKTQRMSREDVLNLLNKAGTSEHLDLRFRNFTECNLDNLDLHESYLSGANLTRAKLRGTNLQGADFGYNTFLDDSYLLKVDLQLDYERLCAYRGHKKNILNDKELNEYAHEKGLTSPYVPAATLEEADLSSTDLRYASFKSAELPKANLSGADLRYANFYEANLQKTNLTNANASRSCMIEANLSGAILTGADIRFSSLWKANLEDIDLTQAKLAGSNFVDANMQNVNMTGMNLSKDTSGLPYPPKGIKEKFIYTGLNVISDFYELYENDKDRNVRGDERIKLGVADLRNAILERTCLVGIYLYGTNLEGANLKDAKVGWDMNMENMTNFDHAKVTWKQLNQTKPQYAGGNLDQIKLPDGTYKTYKPLGSWLKRLF